jgi:DNA-binding IclR family transcriptional regulator
MTRYSPQTDRVIALVNLLAANPHIGFTLAEITRRLKLQKPTVYPMLMAMAEAGFVVRHPVTKLFRLGPALIPVGEAAAEALPMLETARAAVHRIRDELDVDCLAWTMSGGYSTLVDFAIGRGPQAFHLRKGQRIRLASPMGAVVMAWADEDGIRKWADLDEGQPIPPGIADALATIRQRGYSTELCQLSFEVTARLLEEVRRNIVPKEEAALFESFARKLRPHEHPLMTTLDRNAIYDVVGISAPVFDREGEVVMAFVITPFPTATSGRTLHLLGTRLCAEAELATAIIGGRRPERTRGAMADVEAVLP